VAWAPRRLIEDARGRLNESTNQRIHGSTPRSPVQRAAPGLEELIEREVDQWTGVAGDGETVGVVEGADFAEGRAGVAEAAGDGVEVLGGHLQQVAAGGLGEAGGGVIDRAVGRDAGLAMRRGLIAVLGPVGDGFGRSMIAGSAFAFGPVGLHVGLGMKRGTIALFDPGDDFSPSVAFAFSGQFVFPFMSISLRFLRDHGFPIPPGLDARPMARYNGDRLEGGRGEILIPTKAG